MNIFSYNEILNEIYLNIIQILFPLDKINGITENDTYTIFLNSDFKENENE